MAKTGGIKRREFIGRSAAGAFVAALGGSSGNLCEAEGASRPARFGVIGVGARGTWLMRLVLQMPDTQVTAVCDINESRANRAAEIVRRLKANTPAAYTKDEYDYRNLLKRDDVDAVLIATPIEWHAIMALDSMKAGKHVGSEVPACAELEECWELVRTKEEHEVHYTLLENYCYTRKNMMIFRQVQQGTFGDPYYAECGYIHEVKHMLFNPDGSLTWRGELLIDAYGNGYPTHSGGPVCKWLGINRGDRMERLSCYTTMPNRSLPPYAAARFGPDSNVAGLRPRMGDMTTALIKTAQGKVLKIDLDITSNRPHAMGYYLIQGTKGIFDSRFGACLVEEEKKLAYGAHFEWDTLNEYPSEYDHPLWQRYGEKAEETGHWGGDYFVIRDFVNMVGYDREPWIDVYDAVTWSAIWPCTRMSLDTNSAAIQIPDFTGGRWKNPAWRTENAEPV